MLSKSELKFLAEGGTGNPKHDAVMRFRIRRKLLKFQRDDLPAIKHNDWTGRWLHEITDNSNLLRNSVIAGGNENSLRTLLFPNVAPGGRFELPRPDGPYALKVGQDLDETLKRFKQFCIIDLSLSEETAQTHHCLQIRRFLKWLGGREITTDLLRDNLATFNGSAASTRANVVKSFRRFFRDFLKQGGLVETFKLPRQEFRPKVIPTKADLKRFYEALERPFERAVFLMLATSGLRRDEVASLNMGDIDLDKRMVLPNVASTTTKKRWASFFNQETEQVLKEYLRAQEINGERRLFPWRGDRINKWFKNASEKSGIKITPKMLRDWFCSEMGELGVADRYVDAFCGRAPRSILARHYTDFSPERLKRIYDNANLQVLS
jgi:integrase